MSRRLCRPLLLLVPLFAGCGGSGSVRPAGPQEVGLGWGQKCDAPRVRVRAYFDRFVVGRDRWTVSATVANRGRSRVFVTRPLELKGRLPGQTFFGLKVFRTASKREVEQDAAKLGLKPPLIADRFVPPLPRVLRPHSRWSGRFSGRGSLPRHAPIRIVLGRFEVYAPYAGYLCVSDGVIRLR